MIQKILARTKNFRSKFFERKKPYPFITNSQIQFPDLVNTSAIILNSIIRGHVTIGNHSKIVDAHIDGNVSIGCWTTFNGPNSDIYAAVNSVKIGNFVSIARNVSIQEYDHVFERLTSYFVLTNVFGEKMEKDIVSKGDILIGNDVWIGTQSVIVSGANISDGSVIGANSVVNSFIPPYAIAVGSPAKVVKYRFSDHIIERLLRLAWWDWNDERIRVNRHLFDGLLTEEKLDQVK